MERMTWSLRYLFIFTVIIGGDVEISSSNILTFKLLVIDCLVVEPILSGVYCPMLDIFQLLIAKIVCLYFVGMKIIFNLQ